MVSTAYAAQTVDSGLVVVFIAVVPVMMTVAPALFLRQYPTRLEAAGVAVNVTVL